MKWSEVSSSPEFQKMTPVQKYRTEEDFFNTNIATDPEYKPEYEDKIKSDLFGRKQGNFFSEIARGTALGFEELPAMFGDLVAWNQRMLPKNPVSDMLIKAANNATNWIRKQEQNGFEIADPESAFEPFSFKEPGLAFRQSGRIIGQAFPSILAAWITGGASYDALLAKGLAPKVAGWWASAIGSASLGIPVGATKEEEYLKKGVKPVAANLMGVAHALGNTVFEIFPMNFLLKGGTGKRLTSTLITGLSEGGEEVIQQIWDNLVTKIGYDKTQKWYEGTVESFIGGAGSGGLLGWFSPGYKAIDDEVDSALGKKNSDVLRSQIGSVVEDSGPALEERLSGLREGAMEEQVPLGEAEGEAPFITPGKKPRKAEKTEWPLPPERSVQGEEHPAIRAINAIRNDRASRGSNTLNVSTRDVAENLGVPIEKAANILRQAEKQGLVKHWVGKIKFAGRKGKIQTQNRSYWYLAPKTKKIILYHVTSPENAKKIRASGELRPSQHFGKIFLTDKEGAEKVNRHWLQGNGEVIPVEVPENWVTSHPEGGQVIIGTENGKDVLVKEYKASRNIPIGEQTIAPESAKTGVAPEQAKTTEGVAPPGTTTTIRINTDPISIPTNIPPSVQGATEEITGLVKAWNTLRQELSNMKVPVNVINFMDGFVEIFRTLGNKDQMQAVLNLLNKFTKLTPQDLDEIAKIRTNAFAVRMMEFINNYITPLEGKVVRMHHGEEQRILMEAAIALRSFATWTLKPSTRVRLKPLKNLLKKWVTTVILPKTKPLGPSSYVFAQQLSRMSPSGVMSSIGDLSKLLNVPITFMKKLGKKGMGITFGGFQSILRKTEIRTWEDIFTALHEMLGHAVDFSRCPQTVQAIADLAERLNFKICTFSERLGLPYNENDRSKLKDEDYRNVDASTKLTPQEKIFAKECFAVSDYVRPGNLYVSYDNAKQWVKEAIADTLSLLAIDPKKAKELAPNFIHALETYINTDAPQTFKDAMEMFIDFSDTSMFLADPHRTTGEIVGKYAEDMKDFFTADLPEALRIQVKGVKANSQRLAFAAGVPFWIAMTNKFFAPVFKAIDDGFVEDQRINAMYLRLGKFHKFAKWPKWMTDKLAEALYIGNWQDQQREFTPSQLRAYFQFNDELIQGYQEIRRFFDDQRERKIAALKRQDNFDGMTPEQQTRWLENVLSQFRIEGYIPIKRRGKYALWGEKDNGKNIWYRQGDKKALEEMAVSLSKMGYLTRVYYLEEADPALLRQIYANKSKFSVNALKELVIAAGVRPTPEAKAVLAQLENYIATIRSQKYQLKRDYDPGYEETWKNLFHTMCESAIDTARFCSIGMARAKAWDIIRAMPREAGMAKEYAQRYVNSLENLSSKGWTVFRYLTYLRYLSWKFSFGVINLTQPLLTTWPKYGSKTFLKAAALTSRYISAHVAESTKRLLTGNTNPSRWKIGNAFLDYWVNRAWDEGQISGNLTMAQLGIPVEDKGQMKIRAHGGITTRENLASIAGVVGNMTELPNRLITVLCAIIDAESKIPAGTDMKTRKALIDQAIKEGIGATQFIFGKHNMPLWVAETSGMAGTYKGMADTIYLFKGFPANYLGVLLTTFTKGSGPQKIRTLVALLGLSGIEGLPFLALINWAIKALFHKDWEREMREKMGPENSNYANLLLKGVGTLFNVDVSRSIGLGDILSPDYDPAEQLYGPSFGILMDIKDSIKLAEEGKTERAIEKFMPTMVQNLMTSHRWGTEGVRSPNGTKIHMPTPYAIYAKAFGFNPLEVSLAYEREEALRYLKERPQKLSAHYNEMTAKAEMAGDWKKVRELRDEVAKYNAAVSSDQKIKIDKGAVKRRKKAMVEGYSYPKKMRAKIREMKELYTK